MALTPELKRTIVRLRNAGVTSAVIADAFGITRQTVAAFKAWDTMRNSK